MGEFLFSYILNDLELPFDISHKNDLVYLQLLDLKWFVFTFNSGYISRWNINDEIIVIVSICYENRYFLIEYKTP